MLCAILKIPSLEAIEEANCKADLIEFRLDTLPAERLKELRTASRLPVIFKGESEVLEHLDLVPDYVDLPYTAHQALEEVKKRLPNTQRIASLHDFEQTPEDLSQVYQAPAEIFKVACQANSTLDALRMLLFVKNRKRPTIGISMGEKGIITRVLAPVVGSLFTYAPIDDSNRSAPGQLLLNELIDIYNYRRLNKETALYGLLGNPIAQSPSYKMHNATFAKNGINAVYVKLQITPEELPVALKLAAEVGFCGFSVTIPLKEEVVKHIDRLHDMCGAINTLVRRGELWEGWNTDGIAAVDAIEKRLPVRGKEVVILGAGGAAVAIAVEAAKRGAKLTILNRTLPRAQALAARVGGRAASLDLFPKFSTAPIVVQCTPVGMGEDKNMPVDPSSLAPGTLFMEIITKPPKTPLLRAAEQHGCITIEGLEMFIAQAHHQYRHWSLNV